MAKPKDIRRRRIPPHKTRERVKFLREWMRGFDAKDGIDLRKKLTDKERRRINRAYNKLRKITPGVDSQQRWVVKEVRSERSSKLFQEYAKLPVRIKNLKRVPITSSPWMELRGTEPTFEIDYRARKGKGEVRQRIGKTRVKVIDFDKRRLLSGDAAYLDEIAAAFPENGMGTLVMGGLEQVMMPWASDGELLVQNIMEVMTRYAPNEADAAAILDDEIEPEDAEDFAPDSRPGFHYSTSGPVSPWTQWLEGARIYYMTNGDVAAHVRSKAKKQAKKKPRKKKRSGASKRQRIKGR